MIIMVNFKGIIKCIILALFLALAGITIACLIVVIRSDKYKN